MLEAIKEIGEILINKGVEFPIEVRRFPTRVSQTRQTRKKEPLLTKIIFDIDTGELDCDSDIKYDEKRSEEFLWVKYIGEGQKPQIRLTIDDPRYLLNPPKPNKWVIGEIIKEIENQGLDKDPDIKELRDILRKIKEKFFREGRDHSELEKVLSKKGCASREVVLYTVAVKEGGKIIEVVKKPGYRKFLHYMLYESGIKKRGKCHVCGKEGDILANPSYPGGTMLCVYNIDKAGFMPNLSKDPENMLKAHAVCPDCKKKLLVGLNYVEQNLSSSIGKLNVYLIPRVMGIKISYEMLNEVSNNMKNAFNAAKTLKSLEKVEDFLENLRKEKEYEGLYFLDILFGYREGSQFVFQYYIQDVPLMRLVDLADKFIKLSGKVASWFNENLEQWSIGFEDIYRIFPLRIIGDKVEWKPLVELYNSMITSTKFPKETIISRAVLYARINRYGIYGGYNVEQLEGGETELCRNIFKYNMLLKILKEIGVIELDENIEPSSLEIPNDIKEFFHEMGYSEWQKALFLLGVLVGEIGVEQYKKGDKKKSILEKINFDGMSCERTKILANHVLEGLRNYRILEENEKIYAVMKKLLDKNIEALKNPVDNVFYILSGYAYITLRHILQGGEK